MRNIRPSKLGRRREHNSRGQALPLVAFAIIALLGVSSLVVDEGYWAYEQRMAQAAADSAAIAGANELPYVTTTPNPVPLMARNDAALNGFANVSGTNNLVTVNNPPVVSVPYGGNNNAVEVIITKQQTASLSGIFRGRPPVVSGRAVALRGTAIRNCLYGLGTGTAITVNSGTTIYMPNCGIISNGNFLNNGGTITANSIGYVGSNQNPHGGVYPEGQPLPASPAIDPCPSIPGCAYLKANPPTSLPCLTDPYGGHQNYNYNDAPGLTLQAGRYCGSVNINGGPYAVTFAPGTYDFDNGFNDNGVSELDGNGVTFYINGGAVTLNGSSTTVMNLVAPSSGYWQGVLFFQPSTNSNSFNDNISGGASGPSGSFAGMIYLPSANFTLDGTFTTWALVAAQTITLNSNSQVNVPSASFPGATTRPASLVE
jgi:hypothetical protein